MDNLDRADARSHMTRRRVLGMAVPVLAGLLAVALWWVAPWHAATPVTLRGEAMYALPHYDVIRFAPDSRLQAWRFSVDHRGEGFAGTLPDWVGPDNVHHSGGHRIPCLDRGEPAPVELSFVVLRPSDGPSLGARVATGVRCLD